MALALRSGISVAAWLDEDERTIHTALDLLGTTEGSRRGAGPLMHG